MNLLEAIELHLPRGFGIEKPLGAGGTSSVYLARHEDTGEHIVVKVMRPGTVTAESIDRFFQEMQTLKKLEHPRIVPILDLGEANGALFFTMPYLAAETLRARLYALERLPVRDALLISRDVADALGHAHSKGVVHRDVKPENILLAADGAYLVDFGFARTSTPAISGGDATRDSGARMIVGTPNYMSPEQVRGKRAEDWRSDHYSLGCVMFEMLTGRAPFASGSRRATMNRRLTEAAADVRTLRPEVPADVADLVRRTLELDPSKRFDSAGFLKAAIDGALGAMGD